MKCCALLLMALALTGCQSLEPWQRGILAKPEMAVTPLPGVTARMRHVQSSREAGASATAAGGGGCGCY